MPTRNATLQRGQRTEARYKGQDMEIPKWEVHEVHRELWNVRSIAKSFVQPGPWHMQLDNRHPDIQDSSSTPAYGVCYLRRW